MLDSPIYLQISFAYTIRVICVHPWRSQSCGKYIMLKSILEHHHGKNRSGCSL